MELSCNSKIPTPAVERLTTYLRCLYDFQIGDIETFSSADMERATGINAAQFRKDLSYFGEFGRPGVGYNVHDLQLCLARILKVDSEQSVFLVGAGHLGSALLGYSGLRHHKFNIVSVFDNNFNKIGRPLWNLEILDIKRLKEMNDIYNAKIAILALPAPAAQSVADQLVAVGIKVILNFAPTTVRVPKGAFVRNVCFVRELTVLSFLLPPEVP